MNSRKGLSLLAALPIAWLLFAPPVSARDPGDDESRDGHNQVNTQYADGRYLLLYPEQGGDRDINRELAAYQRTKNQEENQGNLDRERQDSRERNDEANRYYWWWPFRR